MARRLALTFEDVPALERAVESRFLRGEATVPGVTGLEAFMPCELVIHHPGGGEPLTIGATVIASPEEQEREGGVRLMLDEGNARALRDFVARRPAQADDRADDRADDQAGDRAGVDREASAKTSLPPPQRLRRLTIAEQIKLARKSPSLTERTTLERILGTSSWEPLLRNPHLTVPEVARIARKGTVPRPLIEQIVNNQGWARSPTVRRALLANPKLTPELILKVLRLAPPSELKLVLKQTAYPPMVRTVAERLMGRS